MVFVIYDLVLTSCYHISDASFHSMSLETQEDYLPFYTYGGWHCKQSYYVSSVSLVTFHFFQLILIRINDFFRKLE